jgi:hypothetical protein
MGELAAAIDIGSNTVHMLAGRWCDGRIGRVDEAACASPPAPTSSCSPQPVCAMAS